MATVPERLRDLAELLETVEGADTAEEASVELAYEGILQLADDAEARGWD